MYTIKPVLDTRYTSHSRKYPVKLRITFRRKSWYLPVGLSIQSKFWNSTTSRVKTSYPNCKLYNLKIKQLFLQVESRILEEELDKTIDSLDQIKALFTQPERVQDFISYGRYLTRLMEESGRTGNARSYRQSINKLAKYLNSETCLFNRLDHGFLREWEVSMKKEGMKQNSIASYFRSIRVICNQAIKDELMPQSWYPFRQFKIRTEATPDRSLSLKEIRRLYQENPSTKKEAWCQMAAS